MQVCGIGIALLVTCWLSHTLAQDHVLVETDDGPVQGQVLTLHTGDRVNTFLGIPFAEPPVGHLRWQHPERPEPWTQPFIADELGPACTQVEVGVVWLTNPLWVRYHENCLNLNVFAPNSTEGGPFPVIVWIFGGGNQGGANVQYPGHFLAAKGAIVVVPNYRLNVIGYLTTGDAAAPGNYAMFDQIHALKWVQRNIQQFGGDPNRVMLAGESSGGASTGLHLLSSLSRGLFHSVFMSSGNDYMDWSIQKPESEPARSAFYLAEQYNCPTDNTWAMVDCLREVDARDLRETYRNCTQGSCGGMGPVVDEVFLTDTPRALRAAGSVARVPEIIGINREEGSMTVPSMSQDSDGFNQTEYKQAVRDIMDLMMGMGILPEGVSQEDITEALTWYYSPWPHLDDQKANRYQLAMLLTDSVFGYATDYQAKLHLRLPAPVYRYVFAYISSNATIIPDWMGCPHGLDVPNVFGYPMLQLNPAVREQMGIVDAMGYTDVDILYSDFWMTLTTNFARTHDPTPEPVAAPNGGPAVKWLPSTEEHLHYMYVGSDHVSLGEDYRQHEYAFWHSYLNGMVHNNEWPFPDWTTAWHQDVFMKTIEEFVEENMFEST